MSVPLQLRVRTGKSAGTVWIVESGQSLVAGRSRANAIVIADDSNKVSSRHCMIEQNDEGVWLTDLNSTNGTYLNGNRVNSAQMRLRDELRIGDVVMLLEEFKPVDSESAPTHQKNPSKVEPLNKHEESQMPETEAVSMGRPFELDRIPKQLGPYHLTRLIGRGGFGAVFEVWDSRNQCPCALKLFAPDRGATPKAIHRFLREQKISYSLEHPNIVKCYETGEIDGYIFMAMELMAGGDAQALVSPDTPLRTVLNIAVDLFHALAYAHSCGVVHRDVKAANLLLSVRNSEGAQTAKLTDFGLAKEVASNMGQLTRSGEVGGSMLMMSPEQMLQFKAFLPSADIYSAAATLVRILTGHTHLVLPERASASVGVVANAILAPQRTSVLALRPDIPEKLGQLFDNLLTLDRGFRSSATSTDFAQIFEQWRQFLAH